MTETKKEIIRIAALIYIERLKKWPEVEDDVRVTDSVKAATQIFRESASSECVIRGRHDFSSVDGYMNPVCTDCGVRRDKSV